MWEGNRLLEVDGCGRQSSKSTIIVFSGGVCGEQDLSKQAIELIKFTARVDRGESESGKFRVLQEYQEQH